VKEGVSGNEKVRDGVMEERGEGLFLDLQRGWAERKGGRIKSRSEGKKEEKTQKENEDDM